MSSAFTDSRYDDYDDYDDEERQSYQSSGSSSSSKDYYYPKKASHPGDPPRKSHDNDNDDSQYSDSYYSSEEDSIQKAKQELLQDDDDDDEDYGDDQESYYSENDPRDNHYPQSQSQQWRHLSAKSIYDSGTTQQQQQTMAATRAIQSDAVTTLNDSSRRGSYQEETTHMESKRGYVFLATNAGRSNGGGGRQVYPNHPQQQLQQQQQQQQQPEDNAMWLKYKQKNRKGQKKKRCLVYWLALLFLGAMGYLVYWLYTVAVFSIDDATLDDDYFNIRGNADNNNNNNGTTPTSNPPPVVVRLDAPPPDFTNKCSRATLRSNTLALLECQGICRQAECCYVPMSEMNDTNTTTTTTATTTWLPYRVDSCRQPNTTTNANCALYSPLCDFIYGNMPATTTTTTTTMPNKNNNNHNNNTLFGNSTTMPTTTNTTTTIDEPDNNNTNQTNTTTTIRLPGLPTVDLTQICALDRVANSLNAALACIDACYEGYCCYSSYSALLLENQTNTRRPSCFDADPGLCQQHYAPCLAVLVGQIHALQQQQQETQQPPDPTNTTNSTASNNNDNNNNNNNNSTTTSPSTIPNPPLELINTCSETSLNTEFGFIFCMDDCFPSLCCVDTENSCLTDNLGTCQLYTPCQSLIGRVLGTTNDLPANNNNTNGTSGVTIPPSNISNVCAVHALIGGNNNSTLDECLRICAPGQCCFDTTSTSCLSDNLVTCLLYTPCENLLQVSNNSTNDPTNNNQTSTNATSLVPVPVGLEQACSAESLASLQGYAECAEKCAPAECCSADCFQENLAACLLYSPCQALVAAQPPAGVALDPAPADLSEVCNSTNILLPAMRLRCEDACVAGTCCTSTENNCYAQLAQVCDTYQPCSILATSPPASAPSVSSVPTGASAPPLVGLPPPPDNLAALCDTDLAACADACRVASCCNTPLAPECGAVGICVLYVPCVALADSTEPSVSVSPSVTPVDLVEACSDSYTSLNGAEICAEMCAPARCCFTEPTASDSCVANLPFCLPFEPCRLVNVADLLPRTPVPTAATDIGDACLIDVIQSSEAAFLNCQELCLEGACCFGSTLTECAVNCDNYAACQPLFFQGSLPSAPLPSQSPSQAPAISIDPGAVASACSADALATEEGRNSCITFCRNGVCCFLPPGNANSCAQDQTFCSVFDPCLSLTRSGRSQASLHQILEEETDAVELNTIDPDGADLLLCDPDDPESGNLERCFEYCEANSCCYRDPGCPLSSKQECHLVIDVCSSIMDLA